jgi:NAD+ diphosphatase
MQLVMPLSTITNTFAGNPLNRASDKRTDLAWMQAQMNDANALAIAIWNGSPLVEDGPGGKPAVRLSYLPVALARSAAGDDQRLLFLGLWKDSAVFAVDLEGAADPTEGPLSGFGRFQDLRAIALTLPDTEAAIAATAKGVFEWRRKHTFCSVCGQPTLAVDGGWRRQCESCRAEHFPRTDPVVIMLPTFGDKCLLGRQSIWPKGMYSALAGFLEPGEAIEEACARELAEEAGLHAVAVRYHSSQPWPYPSSLMIGLLAEVEDEEGRPDQTELSEVRWFTRAEARELLAGRIEGVFCPPPNAIAHQLIKAWAEQSLP